MVLLAVNFDNLHQILQNLYVEMMPLCSQMTGVARGLPVWVLFSMWRIVYGRLWPVPNPWMSFRFYALLPWGFVSCSFRHSFWVR